MPRWLSAALGVALIAAAEAAAQPAPTPAGSSETRSDWNVSPATRRSPFATSRLPASRWTGLRPASMAAVRPWWSLRAIEPRPPAPLQCDVRARLRPGVRHHRRPHCGAGRDHAVRLEGTYDYRAYPARDMFVSGLDLGVGVQTGLAWRSLSRRYAPAIDHSRSEREAGVAGVAAARFGRWPRSELEVAWTAGARDRAIEPDAHWRLRSGRGLLGRRLAVRSRLRRPVFRSQGIRILAAATCSAGSGG